MKTGIITTDSYLKHNTGQGHPERADRVKVVIENLKKNKRNKIRQRNKEFSAIQFRDNKN